jgi:hypothetical protein
MGLLNAFLGGAFGQGLEQTAANMERRDARREEMDLQDRRLREQLDARQRLQDDRMDAAMDRVQARIDAAGGKGGGSGSGSGGRRALIERDQAEIAGDAVHDLASRTGMSVPEAQRAIDAYQSGDNPYRRTGADPSQILDPRDAKAGADQVQPDEEKFRQVMRSVATAFKRSIALPKDATDAAKAAGEYQQQDITSGVLDGGVDAGRAGRAVAAGAGKGAYKVEGNTRLDQFSGDMTPTEVGKGEIRKDDAAAAEHSAKAGKVGVERKTLEANGGMTPSERTGLLNSYRAMVDDAQREVATATQRLEKAQSRKATLPDDKKAKDAEIASAQQALDAATRKKGTAEQNLADLQQERREAGTPKGKDGQPTKKTSAAERARIEDDRRIALSMVGKPKKGGGTVTREDVAARFKAAYGEEL